MSEFSVFRKVFLGCWNSSEEIVNYMHDHGLGRGTKDFIQLWAEFHVNAIVLFSWFLNQFQILNV